MGRISQGGGDPAGIAIEVNESGSLDTIAALPTNREGGIGFFDVDWFGPITGQPRGELIGRVEQPSVAGFGGEQDKLTDGDDAPVVAGCPTLNVAHLIGETELLPSTLCSPAPRLIVVRPIPNLTVVAMELFTKLFANLLAFVYHCFDRIVIHGYLSALSRPEQVVHFVRQVVGVPVVSKEVLSQRTADYQSWVEAYARNHHTPIEWAEKGVRKEDQCGPGFAEW